MKVDSGVIRKKKAMRKRAKWETKEGDTYMSVHAIDSMGVADVAWVGDGLVGEGDRAVRSSISEIYARGAH